MALINNIPVEFNPGETILEVATRYGFIIPTLCADNKLKKTGHCRICLVKVNDVLMTACDTDISEDMNIITSCEQLKDARKYQLELLLVDHNTNCLTCVKNTKCKLQSLAAIICPNYTKPTITNRFKTQDKAFCIDMNRCIRCYNCLNICPFDAIKAVGSGKSLEMEINSNCNLCGKCTKVCPVGALAETFFDNFSFANKAFIITPTIIEDLASAYNYSNADTLAKLTGYLKRFNSVVFDFNLLYEKQYKNTIFTNFAGYDFILKNRNDLKKYTVNATLKLIDIVKKKSKLPIVLLDCLSSRNSAADYHLTLSGLEKVWAYQNFDLKNEDITSESILLAPIIKNLDIMELLNLKKVEELFSFVI